MIKKVPLGEVAYVAMGSAPAGESYNESGQGIPMIAGAGDYGEKHPKPKKWTTAPSRITEIGDLIICVRATIGDLNWADKKYCLGRGVAGIRAKTGKLYIRYAAHYLNSKKKELIKLGTGSTFLAIRRADLEEFCIPLPTLPEQKRIAAILDKADAIRRKRQQAIKLADDFLRATFLDMFDDPVTNSKGWEVKPLGELVVFKTGKLDSNAAVEGGRYPFFTCSRDNFQIDTYAFDCEALLLAGNNAAAEYSVKYYKGRFNAYQRTYVITIIKNIFSYSYLHRVLEMKLQDLKRMSKGTNTKYLTLEILKNLQIQIPSREALVSFNGINEKIEVQKNKLQYSSKMTDMNFNSLTQRAFRGEL
jgi:type I restriction enzyme S subunit